MEKYTIFQSLRLFYCNRLFVKAKKCKENEDYKKALRYLNTALDIFKKVPVDPAMLSVVYNNIGDTYYNLLNYQEALKFFMIAKDQVDEEGNRELYLYKLYKNIAFCYRALNNTEQFIDYLHKTIDLEQDDFIRGQLYINLAYAHRQLNQFNEAIDSVNLAYSFFEGFDVSEHLGNCHVCKAFIHISQEDYRNAAVQLEKAEAIFEDSSSKDHLLQVYKSLEHVYQEIGFIDTAVLYKSKFNKCLNQ